LILRAAFKWLKKANVRKLKLGFMINVLIILIVPFVISYLLTPVIIKFSTRYKIGSCINHRTIHKKFIPSLGGLSIFAGFFIGAGLVYFLFNNSVHVFNGHFFGLLAGSSFILGIGLYDDLKGANCYQKFFFQIVAAIAAYYFGFRIEYITNIFGSPISLGIFSLPVTVLWIAGISNAINLMDGLDGLAAGISIIISATLLCIAYELGNLAIVLITLPFIGALLGFIRHNMNPARVFMGDTGSLFLGFILACISIKGSLQSPATVITVIPIIVLGIPLLDTFLAIARRLMLGTHPFQADKDHIHHRLLKKGLNHRQSVVIIYAAAIFLGLYAYLITLLNYRFIGLFLGFLFILAVLVIGKLGYVGLIMTRRREKIKNRIQD